MIHIPTFRITDAYVGLLAGMCCIGACYSDLVSAANVRETADYFRSALEVSSRVFSEDPTRGEYGVKPDYVPYGHARQDLEELQAAVMSHVLLTWHGSPSQRERARRSFPSMVHVCRRAGLLRVSNDPSVLYSHLHQPDFSDHAFSAANFDWQSWVEQEKRIRLLFSIFLCDVSLGLYFNTGPELETMELKVPVPADDAAWDASSATECSEALGLYGPQLARERNPDGTQRCRQPEIHLVLKALLHGSYQIQPGTTNLYGKFIIIHALLAMLRRIQLDGNAALLNRSNTPLPQHDWIVGIQSSTMNGNNSNSGRATPVNANSSVLDSATLKAFVTALDKFKSNWDIDMAAQFPPSALIHPRRYGFSRDGIHFYYLAKYLLKTMNPADLQMGPDQRFAHVIHLLKSVREWVLNDGASRGEELGSVGEIDKDYGLTDLTLDMAQLFKPLPKVVESPEIPSVQTELGIGNGGIL